MPGLSNFAEEYGERLLLQLGFEVSKIEECDEPRPDFLARAESDAYLVEVKEKRPDAGESQDRDIALRSGSVFDDSYVLVRQPLITRIVSNASRQLTALDENAYRIILFVCTGHNAEARVMQIEASLFGSTTVVDWTDENGQSGTCFYFGHSDFHRYRDRIDGVIVLNAETEQAKLLVNSQSPNYCAFRDSAISRAFGGAVVDPIALEAEGCFIVDSDVDRNDKNAVLNYLKTKYDLGQRTIDMDMNFVSAQVLVPDDSS